MTMLSSQAASRNYATRPPDERFESVQAMIAAALDEKNHSAEKTYNLKELRAVPTVIEGATGENFEQSATLQLESPKGRANFTHWSFSQLCTTLGAPSKYLRQLPPTIAADCLNHGLQSSPAGSSANLLVRLPNDQPTPIVRACTSESYGRLWDAELYSAVHNTILDKDARWTTPPTWTGEAAGAYRGDRDSFMVIVNGGSIVNDPSLRGSSIPNSPAPTSPRPPQADGMYRGILIRNSEVGAASVTIETILFRYICGNHMLWGAILDKQFRRRHFGNNVQRDTVREISRIAYNWTNASAARDEAIIKLMIDKEIAHTKEGVIDELRAIGATKEQAEQAYALCEQHEACSPRSHWGAVQGLTRLAQDTPYQDSRYVLDKIAALQLAKAAKLVRV